MIQLYAVLFGASILALISDRRTNLDDGKAPKKDIFFFLTAVLLICFVGLRTTMNDTASYIRVFNQMEPFEEISWSIGDNPLFVVLQSFIKKYITQSANAFVFVIATFVVGSYVLFIKNHSADFGYTIFVFIAIGVYGFTAAAMKQTISTAIALIAVDLYLKKKRIIAILILAAAVLIHPYVIVYLAVPFLMDGVWNKKSILLLVGTFIVGAGFSFFIENVLKVTEAIGENYDISRFEDGTGVNILRVLVYLVVPALSFFCRKEIRERDDKFLYLAINLSLLTACFSVLSFMGGAVAVGRLSRYFDVFQAIAIAYIVKDCVKNRQNQSLILIGSICCYAVYYYFYYNAYVSAFGINADYFNHISLLDLIRGWNA